MTFMSFAELWRQHKDENCFTKNILPSITSGLQTAKMNFRSISGTLKNCRVTFGMESPNLKRRRPQRKEHVSIKSGTLLLRPLPAWRETTELKVSAKLPSLLELFTETKVNHPRNDRLANSASVTIYIYKTKERASLATRQSAPLHLLTPPAHRRRHHWPMHTQYRKKERTTGYQCTFSKQWRSSAKVLPKLQNLYLQQKVVLIPRQTGTLHCFGHLCCAYRKSPFQKIMLYFYLSARCFISITTSFYNTCALGTTRGYGCWNYLISVNWSNTLQNNMTEHPSSIIFMTNYNTCHH